MRAVLAALALALTLALSGCAGGGAASAPSADGKLKLRMVSTSPTFTDLPTAVILARNYFDQVGLDVDLDYGASNASLVTQAVISGNAQVGSSGTGAVYNAYAEGMTNLVSMGSTNPSLTFGLSLNKNTIDQLAQRGVTPASPVEQRVQALRGLSITASPAGSTGNAYLRLMLSQYGLNPDTDVTIIPNNDGTAQVATTRQGRANGFAQSFPRSNFPEAEGWGALWLNWATDLPSLLPLASHDYYTTRGWLKQNPEAASRVMKALWLAHRDLQNPTPELRDAVRALPDFRDLNESAFNAGWELAVGAYKGATPLTTKAMFDHQVSLTNYNRKTPLKFGFEDVYDLSAAKAGQPTGGGQGQ
jgi:ABC-type nitrate/sulfonate/bicarbonate transport systems, periplasmic components